ncbi:unnamed protein product [Fraxinus pennsylvanica]|uniref:Iron-sulfur cluster assembly protein n=1 Tax=Fraxinus pennsylvanica TaxID=56036 RepID=A0AAD2DP47_9LAMI|nr:unnamed protein product [Fraxinus pennsylvanica]
MSRLVEAPRLGAAVCGSDEAPRLWAANILLDEDWVNGDFNYKRPLLSVGSASVEAPPTSGGLAPAISLTDNALKHFNKLRSERNEDLCLRIGVRQGGCSY